MKKILNIAFLLILVGQVAFSQTSFEHYLSEIESNNGKLKAMKKEVEAEKMANLSDIYLENPEVEFNYLWGNPNELGNRTDLSISQSFDLATVLGKKKKLAVTKNHLVELEYKANRLAILSEAKEYLIEAVFLNSLISELSRRQEHAQTISDLYHKKLELGDANILELNKAKVNLSSINGEISRLEIERRSYLSELKRLNGGNDLVLVDTHYPVDGLPSDFEEWYSRAKEINPVLAYLKQGIEVNVENINLQKASNLPSLTTGFMREKVIGEDFKGVTVGISIPLWANKNKVRQARLSQLASEEKYNDTQLQFYQQLRNLYNTAAGLQKTSQLYKSALEENNSVALLNKALDAGEITLLEFIMEQSIYYDNLTKTLEAEKDFQLALAKLNESLL